MKLIFNFLPQNFDIIIRIKPRDLFYANNIIVSFENLKCNCQNLVFFMLKIYFMLISHIQTFFSEKNPK